MPHNFLKHLGKSSLIGLLAVTCALPPYALNAASPPEKQDETSDVKPKTDATAPAVKADPSVSFGDYLAGKFAESQGDTGNGIQFLRDSLKREPNNKDVLKSLYRMLVLSGQMDEAIPLARQLQGVKVVEEGSEFTPEMLLALDEAKSGKYAEADKYLSSIQKSGFNSLLLPLMHAWLKLGEGEIKSPVDVKSLATDGHMILPHMYLNAALINDIAGFDKEAEKQYEAAVKDTRIEPFRAVEALADYYARKGMLDKRTKLVDDYLTAHGDSYLADELLAKPADAANSHLLVSNATEGLAEVLYTVANIFHGVRSPAEEIASLHLALYLRPDFPPAQFLMASAYELGQDYKSAVTAYETINKTSPYYMRGRIRSVYDEIELGHKETAFNTLDAIAHENPSDIDALLAKGDILRLQNKYQDAIAVYDETLARVKTPQKRHWIIYFSRGACYQLLGQWQKAEADMKQALALDPTEPEVLNYLGYSWLTMRENIPEAKKMIAQAYDARPEDAHIIDSMGYAYYVSGDFANAQEYFDQALERTPNDPTVNDHLGDTYWQLGRKTEARFQWERALADSPDKDTEKDLHKKLKEGLALLVIHAEQPVEDNKQQIKPAPSKD